MMPELASGRAGLHHITCLGVASRLSRTGVWLSQKAAGRVLGVCRREEGAQKGGRSVRSVCPGIWVKAENMEDTFLLSSSHLIHSSPAHKEGWSKWGGWSGRSGTAPHCASLTLLPSWSPQAWQAHPSLTQGLNQSACMTSAALLLSTSRQPRARVFFLSSTCWCSVEEGREAKGENTQPRFLLPSLVHGAHSGIGKASVDFQCHREATQG